MLGRIGPIACALFVTALAAAQPATAQERWVYHHDPDHSSRNPGRFQAVLNAALRSIDPELAFKSFRRQLDLEEEIARVRPAYLIVGSAWLQSNRKRLDLRKILVPSLRGQSTFTRVLVTRTKTVDSKQLSGLSVAANSLENKSSFRHSFGGLGLKPGQLRVVRVTKDVDALMALALDQVDLALVRPESIQRIGRVNPNVSKGLRTLMTSPPISLAPLVSFGAQPAEQSQRLRRGLETLSTTPLGRRALRMLGVDAWKAAKEGTR